MRLLGAERFGRAAYTMFNVYLPKLLEGRGAPMEEDVGATSPKSLSASMWDVVIYALGGCPGAVVSAARSLHFV